MKTTSRTVVCSAALFGCLTSPAVRAQQADEAPAQPAISKLINDRLAVDLSVPASPAMAVLGVGGTEIDRPAFPRDLAASLIKGFDKDGKNRDAFAIDVVPASLWLRSSIIGGEKYDKSPWKQILARTTLSLGAAKVEDTKDGGQYGAGIRIGLYDDSDPGLYWAQKDECLKKIWEKIPLTSEQVPDGGPVLVKIPQQAATACALDMLVADLWAKPALYIGYAQGWHSDTASVRDASGSAKAFWASFSVGLNPRSSAEVQQGGGSDRVRGLVQLYLARKLDERITNPAGTDDFVGESRSELVARLRFGKVKWHAYAEAGVARTRTAGLERESIRRTGFGVEYMLREDLWLVLGSMREAGFRNGTRSLINTGLRFSQVPKALFDLPRGGGR